jgi:energy-coupling factor transporter ATP-binding protein EcfA2
MPDLSQELLASSAKYPKWQRDAMRRLTIGKIQEQDYVELVALAKAENASPSAGVPVAVPLAPEHLSQAHAGGGVTTLLSIHEVEGVNALEPNQKLNFSHQGITVVFGRNGAGKSGYSRVLRCACRARKAPSIIPNVIRAGPVITPRAKFSVRNSSGDSEVSWVHAQPSPDELAHLAVFDRECEKDIIDERGEATFIPPGLNRYDELVRVVDEVKRRIESERQAALPTEDLQELLKNVSGSKTLVELLGTVIADQTDDIYRRITESVTKIAWGPEQEVKLASARAKLLAVGDPVAKANSFRSLAGSIKAIRKTIEDAEPIFGVMGEKALLAAKEHAFSMASASALADAGVDFSKEAAAKIGLNAWQELYKAAANFALEGFAAEPRFPSSDAKCPLCLQDLDSTAQDRVRRFKSFMSKEAKVASDRAKAALDALVATIKKCSPQAVDLHIAQQVAAQTTVQSDVLTNISVQLMTRRDQLIKNATTTEWQSLTAFPTATTARLVAAEGELEAKAKESEKIADPLVRMALEQELKTYEAEQMFAAQREHILKIVSQYAKAAALGRIAGSINTKLISMEGKSVAEKTLTGGLKAAFTVEMKNLGADGIVLADINHLATKGKTTFGIGLTGKTGNAKNGNILSEGEQRVVALAYFLAEVQSAPDKVGIILDDPVSSLDYHWENRIAKRIAEMAVDRQVIVFTHSVSLVLGIENHAVRTRAPFTRLYIEKTANGAGHHSPDGAPFNSLPVAKRIEVFKKQRIPVLVSEFDRAPTGHVYAELISQFGGQLRSAWERAVEELVFCDVIKRFGNAVHTKMLKRVVCKDETFRQVNDAMSKLSEITEAHDTPQDGPSPYPNPDEVKRLIEDLETFRKYQMEQNEAAEKERKKYEKTAVVSIAAETPSSVGRKN